jgi:ribosome recycling factor
VHKSAEHHKVGVREARRDGLAMLKDLERDGLSSDERHRGDKRIQDLTDEYSAKVDELVAQKEKEILEV